ncbi:GAF domain-containing protein [Pseudooceanicola sp. CBS1P-1]|uniref:GAF domain-containing protein n=1 Tax=Pseudooceanicola albus TaxID=2692189 RepID=A0A6L7G4Q9_9RHOB|nr:MULTISPECIES: GAF domain-containing protein [Pseudooceanicola]MBT9385312.1 GAF domain-containing protein [Pseudooceanicola endophyticus]MXN18829.1 GAF domain-containing protein [Pseudooceanicola albus]
MTTTPCTSDFLAAIATEGTARAAFAALHAQIEKTVGAKIFTMTENVPEKNASRRLYTSHPVEYPTSALKPNKPGETDWTDCVITHHNTYVANDLATIDTVFPDAPLIDSLGCQSVINLPIIIGGQVIGTLNILHEAGWYTPERVAATEALRLQATTAMLLSLALDAKEAA